MLSLWQQSGRQYHTYRLYRKSSIQPQEFLVRYLAQPVRYANVIVTVPSSMLATYLVYETVCESLLMDKTGKKKRVFPI